MSQDYKADSGIENGTPIDTDTYPQRGAPQRGLKARFRWTFRLTLLAVLLGSVIALSGGGVPAWLEAVGPWMLAVLVACSVTLMTVLFDQVTAPWLSRWTGSDAYVETIRAARWRLLMWFGLIALLMASTMFGAA